MSLSCVTVLLALLGVSFGKPLPPYNLKCQGAPVGLTPARLKQLERQKLVVTDESNPVLSWSIAHSERAATQSAFQVVLAEDKEMEKIYWDTGKIRYGHQSSIEYAGPAIRTGKTYFWKVKWWDHNDVASVSEETGHFLTGVLDVKEWDNSKWIAAGDSIKTAPYIHKTISINALGDESATMFVAGLGFNRVFINGEDVQAHYDPPVALDPGWTNYEKLVPYTAYTISLPHGVHDLELGFMLGQGWRNTKDYPPRDPGSIPTADSIERVLNVYLIYFDYSINSSRYLYSDETWSVDETNITSDSIYDGVTYEWNTEPVRDAKVKVVHGPNGSLYAPMIPYIAEMGVEFPIKVYFLTDKNKDMMSQIADFGNNSAGYCQVYCDDEPDYSIRHAEVPLHMPYGPMNGSLYYSNLKNASATDSYDGLAESTYKPFFTYHGFRYVEVVGFVRMSLSPRNIRKIVIHSNVARSSKFSTSIPLLNNIQENCIRGQLSNLMSVVTDCDQRSERLGWMGDASLSAETMTLNFDMHAFFNNYLRLISSEMINGTIPDIVPFYRGGHRPADPSWGAAFPEILYRLLNQYNDTDIANTYYPDVLQYIKTTVSGIPTSGLRQFPNCHFGDWVPPPPKPKENIHFSGASSFLINVKQTMEIAEQLGKTDDAAMLNKTYDDLVKMYNKDFMTSDTSYLTGTQPTYVLPLAVGAVPVGNVTSFTNDFLNHLESPAHDNSHVAGGIITTRYLFPVLSKLKQHEIALKIAQQMDYPSYGYMIHNKMEPATAIWELWDSSTGPAKMDSRNHHMFSSISGWMVTDMAGLLASNGQKEFHFHPARSLGLSHASISLQHPRIVSLSWRRNGGVQCAKQAENQSPLNPNLPKHDDLSISCGDEDGGAIHKVQFASFGNPTGHCGGYQKKGSCHAPNSLEVVERLCLWKRNCVIPSRADFWEDPCPDEVKWLMVSVQCKSEVSTGSDFMFSSVQVSVSVPVGSHGFLHLPAYGKQNLMLWENGDLIFQKSCSVYQKLGIMSTQWQLDSDLLTVELNNGNYSFVWKGDDPQRHCIDSNKLANKNEIALQCNNSNDIITAIYWASFGTPILHEASDCFTYSLGNCHAGSSKYAIEQECVGKKSCIVRSSEKFFGKSHCLEDNKSGRLILEYSCGYH